MDCNPSAGNGLLKQRRRERLLFWQLICSLAVRVVEIKWAAR
jgi:hypothetical protein